MAWTQEDIDDQMFDHTSQECWECGGEGYHGEECECEAFEDTCMCAEPTPARCRTCSGTGRVEGE